MHYCLWEKKSFFNQSLISMLSFPFDQLLHKQKGSKLFPYISQPLNLEKFNLNLLVIDKLLATMLIDVVQTPNYRELTINIKYEQSKYFLYQTPYPPNIKKNNPKFLHIKKKKINCSLNREKKFKERRKRSKVSTFFFLIN